MAIRPIVVWPDARLRQQTLPIKDIDDAARELYQDLVDTMYAYNGLGIAAIQIGDPRQMYLVDAELAGAQKGEAPWAFINPSIEWTGDEEEQADEGCLSFPGIYVPIARPTKARIKATNLAGESFLTEGENLMARCLLHEFDHLNGKLLVDFVGPLKKKMIKRRLKRTHEHDKNNPSTPAI